MNFKCIIKGSVSRDFRPPVFSHDSNPSGPLINRLKYFRIQFQYRWDIKSQRLKNLTPRCASHGGVKILVIASQKNFFKSFLSCNMCSPLKGFLPTVPLRPTRDSQKFWFWLRSVQFDSAVCSLTPRCDTHRGAWLRGGMHNEELNSAVWCTPWSFLSNLVQLTPRWDAHRGAGLGRGMHTAEWSASNISFFRVCYVFQRHLKIKNVWSKNDSLNKFWLTV